jgi:hypothetical protein
MNLRRRLHDTVHNHGWTCLSAALFALTTVTAANAHSASDAYLTLNVDAHPGPGRPESVTMHGQWDVALRDLDFVIKLDDNGDGNITWAELQRHQADIAKYAYGFLKASNDGAPCAIKPVRQMVADHADGAYAALFFDIVCQGPASRVTLDYRLFFSIDPSHRAILVMRNGSDTATSLLSPDNARIDLKPGLKPDLKP